MQPFPCWAWAHTAAEHQHSLSPLGQGGAGLATCTLPGGDSPHQQVPDCWDGEALSWMGSVACRAGSSTHGSVRCSRVTGIDEIKVPVKSQHLFRGRVVQGGLVRRDGDRMCGAGTACQAREGVVLCVGQEVPTRSGGALEIFPGFSLVWACTSSKSCWFKSHSLGPLIGSS